MPRCRPCAFVHAEEPELGTCERKDDYSHKFFSPGTFKICYICAHTKVIGFIVLDQIEVPPSIRNALLSNCALLPHVFI